MPDPSAGILIESLAWPEVENALKTVGAVVIPVGARCKEHGLHLPMNTDWIIAEYLARRVAERCHVLVLPTVQYGYYPAFVEYPGSISIGENVFRDSIADICRSFARFGMHRFYALNTGISTVAPLSACRQILAAENITMDFADLRQFALSQRRMIERQPHGTHADELETSMMLYIAPEVVHLERARAELSSNRPGRLTRDPSGAGVYSPTGAWGDPTLATREKGEFLVEAIVAELLTAIESLIASNLPPHRVMR